VSIYFLTSGIKARVRHIVFIHIVAAATTGSLTSEFFLSRIMSTKFDILKFDDKISFAIWQIQLKVVLTQSVVQKALQTRPADMTDDK
jgi:ABC-type microcin C transport system permease subunit YejB